MASKSAVQLARVPISDLTHQVHLARLHPDFEEQAGLVSRGGCLQHVQLGATGADAIVLTQYNLMFQAEDGTMHPVQQSWNDFQFLEGGLLFCQQHSSKLLFAQLPVLESEPSGVFLFGRHTGEVLSTSKAGSRVISGCAGGSVKLWSLDDGSLLDTKEDPEPARITCVTFIGPLMVAAGSHLGTVTLFDASTHRLQAVHRFCAGPGPVDALAACLDQNLAHRVALAQGPRAFDGGRVVAPPMGLPWRLDSEAVQLEAEKQSWRTGALLAVASSTGWLHIYEPTSPGAGDPCWEKQYSGTHNGRPKLCFSPDGTYLALTSGIDSSSCTLLDTCTWTVAKQWVFPVPLVAVGFGLQRGVQRVLHGAGGMTYDSEPFQQHSGGYQVLPGLKLTLFVAPEEGMPMLLQAILPMQPKPQLPPSSLIDSLDLPPSAHHVSPCSPPQSHSPSPSSPPEGRSGSPPPRWTDPHLPPPPAYPFSTLSIGLMGKGGTELVAGGVELVAGASPYTTAAVPARALRQVGAAGGAGGSGAAGSGWLEDGAAPSVQPEQYSVHLHPGARGHAQQQQQQQQQGARAQGPDATAAGGAQHAAGSSAAVHRTTLRPGTMPIARSWITGAAPPALDEELMRVLGSRAARESDEQTSGLDRYERQEQGPATGGLRPRSPSPARGQEMQQSKAPAIAPVQTQPPQAAPPASVVPRVAAPASSASSVRYFRISDSDLELEPEVIPQRAAAAPLEAHGLRPPQRAPDHFRVADEDDEVPQPRSQLLLAPAVAAGHQTTSFAVLPPSTTAAAAAAPHPDVLDADLQRGAQLSFHGWDVLSSGGGGEGSWSPTVLEQEHGRDTGSHDYAGGRSWQHPTAAKEQQEEHGGQLAFEDSADSGDGGAETCSLADDVRGSCSAEAQSASTGLHTGEGDASRSGEEMQHGRGGTTELQVWDAAAGGGGAGSEADEEETSKSETAGCEGDSDSDDREAEGAQSDQDQDHAAATSSHSQQQRAHSGEWALDEATARLSTQRQQRPEGEYEAVDFVSGVPGGAGGQSPRPSASAAGSALLKPQALCTRFQEAGASAEAGGAKLTVPQAEQRGAHGPLPLPHGQHARSRSRFLGYKPNTAQLIRQIRAQAPRAAAAAAAAAVPSGSAEGGAAGSAAQGGAATSKKRQGAGPGLTPAEALDVVPGSDQRPAAAERAGGGVGAGGQVGLRRERQAQGGGMAGAAAPGVRKWRTAGQVSGSVNFPGGSMVVPSGASSPSTLPSLSSPMLLGSPADPNQSLHSPHAHWHWQHPPGPATQHHAHQEGSGSHAYQQGGRPRPAGTARSRSPLAAAGPGGAVAPGASQSALACPVVHGTARWLNKLQVLMNEPEVQLPVPQLQLLQEEALRRAAQAATDVPCHAQLYPQLPSLEPAEAPLRLGKQLHPGWMASKHNRPDMAMLWSAAEQQRGVCATRPLTMYVRPSASSVAEAILSLI